MSYHTVVSALEAKAGISSLGRFWLAIRHASRGHVPYSRYQQAGFRRAAEGAGSGEVERWIREWEGLDLNPTVQIARASCSLSALAESYNLFNQRRCLWVRTTMMPGNSAASGVELVRHLRSSKVDPEPCKQATMFAMGLMAHSVATREGSGAGETLTAGAVARALGVERSAAASLATVLEAEGPLTVEASARALGCSQRTLQRTLKQEGGTAEEIKIAARLLRAHRLMATGMSLTQIALEAGYSDSAHMSRAFMASCGLTPSEARRASYGDRAARGRRRDAGIQRGED